MNPLVSHTLVSFATPPAGREILVDTTTSSGHSSGTHELVGMVGLFIGVLAAALGIPWLIWRLKHRKRSYKFDVENPRFVEMRTSLSVPTRPCSVAQPRAPSTMPVRPRMGERAWVSSTATITLRDVRALEAPILTRSHSDLTHRGSFHPVMSHSLVAPLPVAISIASTEVPAFVLTELDDPSRRLPAGCTCMLDAVSPLDTREKEKCKVHSGEYVVSSVGDEGVGS